MKANLERRSIATIEMRVATDSSGNKTLTGTIPYNSLSVDLGGFQERIAPGAFASALKSGADVLCLRDHDSKFLLGRTKSGTLSLQDSPAGLTYSCKLPNTTQANDLAESINRGDLDATSFGFVTNEAEWETDAQNRAIRTLIDVELMECSPCSFAAYPDSAVALRSCPVEIRSRIEHRDDSTDTTDQDQCQCQCPECVDGDCADCSDPECDDANCTSGTAEEDSTRSEKINNDDADENRKLAIRLGFADLL